MGRTASRAELLKVCVQDLHAGKGMLADRLPALAAAATDGRLRDLLAAEAARAGEAAGRLEGTGVDVAGPSNLWMAGILDDAARDARSHEPGPLLDVALVGAVRKAVAAQIVSSETAIALAAALGDEAIGAAVRANRAEEAAAGRALRERLEALTSTPVIPA
jgi:ferritin-like metal-binding protein YciE